MKLRVLVVDDEELVTRSIVSASRFHPIACTTVSSLAEAQASLDSRAFDVVLLDLNLKSAHGVSSHGIDTFHAVQAVASGTPIVVMTGALDQVKRVELLKAGAAQVLQKPPLKAQEVIDAVIAAAERDIHRENTPVTQHVDDVSPFLGVVEHFQNVLNQSLASFEARHEKNLDLRFSLLRQELGKATSTPPPAKRKRTVQEVVQQDWPGALKKIAEVAIIIAGAYGVNRVAAQQTVAEVIAPAQAAQK